jgi:hypothetical protein
MYHPAYPTAADLAREHDAEERDVADLVALRDLRRIVADAIARAGRIDRIRQRAGPLAADAAGVGSVARRAQPSGRGRRNSDDAAPAEISVKAGGVFRRNPRRVEGILATGVLADLHRLRADEAR